MLLHYIGIGSTHFLKLLEFALESALLSLGLDETKVLAHPVITPGMHIEKREQPGNKRKRQQNIDQPAQAASF